MRCPFRGHGVGKLHDGSLGGVVGALLLWVQDASPGDGGDEEDTAAAVARNHVSAASLGDDEGAGEIDIEQAAEHGWVVVLGFDVGARKCQPVAFT